MSENKPFIILRDDGFTQFFYDKPSDFTVEKFLRENVDFLADYPDVKVKEFGLGPGSVFTYNTKVGEVFLDNAPEYAYKMCREGDLNVYGNVKKLIESGKDGLQLVTERCHELGKKVWARLEMNHEYGPPTEENFAWVAFVGSLNKQHPEYRICNNNPARPEPYHSVKLDFKYKEVRDFKLKILKEAVEHGVDGVSLDFCVYPPFLSDPQRDYDCITQLVRDVRKMLDEEGRKNGKYLELIVRLEYDSKEREGLYWDQWIKEGLIDWIIPSVIWINDCFDVPNEEFVKACGGTKCKVATCIRPHVGMADTDTKPDDERSGIVRTEKPCLPRTQYAKAFQGLIGGSVAIQAALGSGGIMGEGQDEWKPHYGNLANIEFLKEQEKEYCFNNLDILPAPLTPDENRLKLSLRIGDEPTQKQSATLSFLARGLNYFETIILYVNGHPITLTEKDLHWSPDDIPLMPERGHHGLMSIHSFILFRIDKWWDICRNNIEIPMEYLKKGTNEFEFVYNLNSENKQFLPLEIGDISLIVS
ncbi:MAG: hypothetical protein IKK55_04340 [Clostridia bacterium]|nr:hypothetical protein [Clostridia bacterium]